MADAAYQRHGVVDDIPVKGMRVFQLPARTPLFHTLHLGTSFCFIFLAFSVAQNSQTSLDPTVGAIGLGLLYAVFTFANTFSSAIVKILGLRFGLFLSGLAYAIYVIANIYTINSVLYAVSAVLGLGAAILWTAQGSFIASCAEAYAADLGLEPHSQNGFVIGLFFSLFQTNQFMGNLLAALLYQFAVSKAIVFSVMSVLCTLGVFSLLLLPNQVVPSKEIMQEREHIVGDAAAQPDDDDDDDAGQAETQSLCARTFASLSLFRDRRMILLLLIIIYCGIEQSFIYGVVPPLISEPNQKFYVLSFFGLSNALLSVTLGKVSDRFGRVPVLLLGTVAHSIVYCYFIYLTPGLIFGSNLDRPLYFFFVLAFLLALGDAVFNANLYAILGTYFKKHPDHAYANFKLLQSGSTACLFLFTGQETPPTVFLCALIAAVTLILGMALLLIGNVLTPFSTTKASIARNSVDADA